MAKRKIVLGVTGSIAAYKIPFLIRLLMKDDHEVQVIMTPRAVDFVTPLTLSTLSQKPVIVEPFTAGTGAWNNHVELGRWADVMLFAPVTANTLGKMSGGIADNFLVTAYLSAKCPVFIAPAMDLDMYLHPSTQRNIDILRQYGNRIIEPQVGELASGLSGPGRLEEPEEIYRILSDFFTIDRSLEKKKLLITAGPTFEPIDPVRYLGNRSTGTMGFCLAQEAAERGGEVVLVAGPTHLEVNHPSVRTIRVNAASEMMDACLRESDAADIIIMAAAVADYTPEQYATGKIKKTGSPLTISLKPTEDILKTLGARKMKNQFIAGFALETDNEIKHATQKLRSKKADMIVLNSLRDPGAGFGYTTNKVTMIGKNGILKKGAMKTKKEVASEILTVILEQIKTKTKK